MIKGTKLEVTEKIKGKAMAYKITFDPKLPYTHEVLVDLANFCFMHKSTFQMDKGFQAHLEGRREVFLRIANYLKLDLGEIYQLHNIKNED